MKRKQNSVSMIVFKPNGVNLHKYGLVFCVLFSFVFFSVPVHAAQGKVTLASGVWEDPFGSIKTEWHTLDGYHEREEAARSKQGRALDDGALESEPPPIPQIVTAVRPSVRMRPVIPQLEVDLFDRDVQKEWMSVERAQEEVGEAERARNLLHAFGKDPYDIRYASLPFHGWRPIPAPRVTQPVKERDGVRQTQREDAQKQEKKVRLQKEEREALEALSAYKRRELEAMESDRRTLSALQEALSELGLAEELDYIANKPAGSLMQPSSKTK